MACFRLVCWWIIALLSDRNISCTEIQQQHQVTLWLQTSLFRINITAVDLEKVQMHYGSGTPAATSKWQFLSVFKHMLNHRICIMHDCSTHSEPMTSHVLGQWAAGELDISTFLCEVMSRLPSLKYNVISEIQFSQLMRIYLKNNSAKFHPDLIWNDGTLGFFWRQLTQDEFLM